MTFFESKNKKNIIIIASIFLILIGLAIFLSVKNHRKKSEVIPQAQFTKVSNEPILFPALSSDGSKIYFYSNTRDLAFYQQNIDGSKLEKISGNMDEPDNVIWSPERKYAILEITYDQYNFEKFGSPFASPGTPDQAYTTWVYNFVNQKLTRLSDNIGNIVWQNDDRLICQQKNDDVGSLNISDADGKNSQKITDLPTAQDYGLSFLLNDQLVVYSSPTDVSGSTVYVLNLSDKKLKEIKKTDLPSTAVGLLNGQILLDTQTKTSFKLLMLDAKGSTKKNFKIETSLDNFINLDSDHFIITLQKNSQNNQFILINTKTGKSSVIKDAEDDNINALNLMISHDKKTLYFTSNDILYKLGL